MAETELGARLAERVDRIVAQRQRQNVLVVAQPLVELAERQAFLGERRAVSDCVGDFELIGEQTVAFARVERTDDALPRMLALHAAEPCGQQLDQHIGQRAEAGQEQDHIAPWPEPAGLRRMDDQDHLDQEEDEPKLYRSPKTATRETLTPPA